MTRLERATRDTFRSLRSRNYRLYFLAQVVSVSGTWMQAVAQAWLVLQLTGSGTLLGLTTGLQFLPILVAGPWAGVLADRVDKRRLLIATQSTAALLAVLLGALTAAGVVTLWMVLVLAFAFGCVVAVDNPARQSFVLEMTGPEDLPNAVTLNSVVINAARGIGPAIGGLLIATVGIAVCFLVNGASYLAVIAALVMMRPDELHLGKRASRGPKQLREGFTYVWGTSELRIPLLVMAAVGTFTYEFHVTLPLLAKYTFGGGALAYGGLTAVMGLGAVVGGLASARRSDASVRALLRSSWILGLLILATAFAPNLWSAIVILVLVGAASIRFIATANATLQLGAAPHMRGRVMALWSVAFLGSTPLGGPFIGWVGQTYGARGALVVGGVAALAASLLGYRALARHSQSAHLAPRHRRPAALAGVAFGMIRGLARPGVSRSRRRAPARDGSVRPRRHRPARRPADAAATPAHRPPA
ncbi:MAG: MFS transporter [Nitriliruptorales bacterium]|nr:MFS transporter [Nitriliruptorales bacterium]